MPKSKRLITSLGGTLDPIYRYIQSTNFRLSPFDRNGNKVARCLYLHFRGGDKRLKMENFKLTAQVDPTIQNTVMESVYREVIRQPVEKRHLAERRDLRNDADQAQRVQQDRGVWPQ